MRVEVVSVTFSPEWEMSEFLRGGAAGAVANFVGYCRDEGGKVERLELEHYPGFTQTRMAELVESVASRHALTDALVIHRVGAIPAGEAIVLVAASSPHRAAALAAVSELIDSLKSEAPIWKREIARDGPRWVEPTADDRRAAARWRADHKERSS